MWISANLLAFIYAQFLCSPQVIHMLKIININKSADCKEKTYQMPAHKMEV